jgi:hypothetical protein
MDLRIGHLDFSFPPAAPKRGAADAAGSQVSVPRDHTAVIGGVPALPPDDALREVARAAARAEELWREQRELHFAIDEDSRRVIVQVRDLDDCVIRTISPSDALDVLSGRPL